MVNFKHIQEVFNTYYNGMLTEIEMLTEARGRMHVSILEDSPLNAAGKELPLLHNAYYMLLGLSSDVAARYSDVARLLTDIDNSRYLSLYNYVNCEFNVSLTLEQLKRIVSPNVPTSVKVNFLNDRYKHSLFSVIDVALEGRSLIYELEFCPKGARHDTQRFKVCRMLSPEQELMISETTEPVAVVFDEAGSMGFEKAK